MSIREPGPPASKSSCSKRSQILSAATSEFFNRIPNWQGPQNPTDQTAEIIMIFAPPCPPPLKTYNAQIGKAHYIRRKSQKNPHNDGLPWFSTA